MNEWVELYDAHCQLRRQGRAVVTGLRTVLKRLGEQVPSVFEADVQKRLQPARNPKTRIQTYRLGADGQPEYLALWNVPDAAKTIGDLEEAHLTVLLSLEANDHLRELTLMVEGTRKDGSPWTLAVHLPDDRETERNPTGDRQGHGACSHAALHCHVGPTLGGLPKVRVPLPALSPPALLEWLISQVVPTAAAEPALWAEVVAAHVGGGS